MWLNDLYPSTLMQISERQVYGGEWLVHLLVAKFCRQRSFLEPLRPVYHTPILHTGTFSKTFSLKHSKDFISVTGREVPRIPWCPCVTWDEYRWQTNQLVVVPSIQVSCHHPWAVNGSTLQVICLPVTPLYLNILDGRNRMWYLFFENTVTVLYRQWDLYLPVTLTIRQN